MVPHRPRPFRDQGRRIAAARDDLGLRQHDLADTIRANGYASARQPLISDIERGYLDVPHAMRQPLLDAIPGLELDPPAAERIAS